MDTNEHEQMGRGGSQWNIRLTDRFGNTPSDNELLKNYRQGVG